MTDYALPVSRLLTLGKPNFEFGRGPGYGRFGFGPEHVPELVRMVTDMDLNTANGNSVEVWAPLHAWRALAEIQPVGALDAMLAIHKAVLEETDSDQPGEDLIELSSRLGAAVLPSLERYLADGSMGSARANVAEAIGRIGKERPEQRNFCVAILVRELEHYEQNDGQLNGIIIASLLDLKAVEAAPLMERAFAAEKVDEFLVGDWDEAQYELGLAERPAEPATVGFAPWQDVPGFGPHFDRETRVNLRAKRKAQRQAKKKNRKKKR